MIKIYGAIFVGTRVFVLVMEVSIVCFNSEREMFHDMAYCCFTHGKEACAAIHVSLFWFSCWRGLDFMPVLRSMITREWH